MLCAGMLLELESVLLGLPALRAMGPVLTMGKHEYDQICLNLYWPRYTSFDNFFAAYLSVFRIMTHDSWENLYLVCEGFAD